MVLHQTRKELGNLAEELVSQWLSTQGVQLLARNLRVSQYELDIVALEESSLVIVEVRTRSFRSRSTGFSSFSCEKRRRLHQAGTWLWRRKYQHDLTIRHLRFDAACVHFELSGASHIEYSKAAF